MTPPHENATSFPWCNEADPADHAVHVLICKKTFAFSIDCVLIHAIYKNISFQWRLAALKLPSDWGQDVDRHAPRHAYSNVALDNDYMMRTMILLGSALAICTTGHAVASTGTGTHAAAAPPAYAAPAGSGFRQASFRPPRSSLRTRLPHEPSTYSLLLVAMGLLSLRMRTRVHSEKFTPQ